jgi:hypothetical protein
VENSTQFRVRGRPLGASLSLKGAVHVRYNSAALPFQSYKGTLKRQYPEEPAFMPCFMYSIQDFLPYNILHAFFVFFASIDYHHFSYCIYLRLINNYEKFYQRVDKHTAIVHSCLSFSQYIPSS